MCGCVWVRGCCPLTHARVSWEGATVAGSAKSSARQRPSTGLGWCRQTSFLSGMDNNEIFFVVLAPNSVSPAWTAGQRPAALLAGRRCARMSGRSKAEGGGASLACLFPWHSPPPSHDCTPAPDHAMLCELLTHTPAVHSQLGGLGHRASPSRGWWWELTERAVTARPVLHGSTRRSEAPSWHARQQAGQIGSSWLGPDTSAQALVLFLSRPHQPGTHASGSTCCLEHPLRQTPAQHTPRPSTSRGPAA